MIKSNLPVILLKGLVLLPHEEVRIELNNNISKKIVDLSNLYHDDEILIVSPVDRLEENPDTNDLPKIGVVAKIKSNIVLSNGNSRILLKGLRRVKVFSYVNYSNEKEILESIIEPIVNDENNEIEETVLLRKLFILVDEYINSNSNISNSIMSQIKGLTDLDKLTDIIACFMNLSFDKKFSLMCNASPISRSKFLIKELAIEKKVFDLDRRIDESIETSLSKSQEEYLIKEKINLLKKELGETDSKEEEISKYNEKLDEDNIPLSVKNRLKKEIRRYSLMNEMSPELSVERNYIDTLLSIPYLKYTKDTKDLNKIKKSLDKTHYGLVKAKERILEFIAVKNLTNDLNTPIICLIGPPGVGKTTFAYSVAEALNKKFAKISLSGLSDMSELIGHRRTYIGSSPGKIITSLMKCDSLNPVILLDEIDKIAKDYKGDPSNILLDVLDTTTNKAFIDNFIEEEVDLSKVLFILTANDESEIPKPLLDRVETIHLNGYTLQEKKLIITNYLLDKLSISSGIKPKTLEFDNNSLNMLINNYTKESGIRELERILSKIIRKIILKYTLDDKKITRLKIKEDDILEYLGPLKYNINNNKRISAPGYALGLANTEFGGRLIEIEITSFEGSGKFKYTGRLGKTTNESIEIVLSYIKSNHKLFNINLSDLIKKDYHINFRNLNVIKEGGSAGTVIATSIISYLLNKKIPTNISCTGEMNLNGDISPVGGLKEKIIVASLNGINKIYIPFENKEEVIGIKKGINEKMEFIFVKNYIEIYKDLFK